MRAMRSAILLALVTFCWGQESPCPTVLKYKEMEQGVEDRWEGIISISTDTILYSIWLYIVLDGKAELFGSEIGSVTSSDNKEFRIESTDTKVYPGPATDIEFFVKGIKGNIPRVATIRLNGREICNVDSLHNKLERPMFSTESETLKNLPLFWTPTTKLQTSTAQYQPIFQITTPQPEPPAPETSIISIRASSDQSQSKCGKAVARDVIPLAYKGKPTQEGEWPWQVALYYSEGVSIEFKCGGTLVSQKHVVTAAHCVTNPDTSRAVDKDSLTIYLGKHNLRTSNRGVQIGFVAEIIVHPKYNGQAYGSDISILNLWDPVQYTNFVRPACLWPENLVDLTSIIGKIGSVVGWGVDKNGLSSEQLMLVNMPVVSQETCVDSYNKFFGRYTSNTTFCAGYRDGATVCKGDSGGGMVMNIGGIWHLRGLVSLGLPDVIDGCNPKHYVIFTDVAKFLPWIKEIIHFTSKSYME